jgi:N-acetylglucosamine-6-phosphate deacetylase
VKGFIDLQVNGYAGVDFSKAGLRLDDVRKVASELYKRGTVAFCPTVITAPVNVYEQNLPVLVEAMREPVLGTHLLGIHLEGPFISPEDGARGAHPRAHVLPPSVSLYERLRALAEDKVALVTIAPEIPGAAQLARHIAASGACLALGHHQADRKTVAAACDWGARLSTHLGNGISNMLPRHPNPLWDQLDEDRLWTSLITDGHHLPDAFVRVVLRVKSPSRLVVVSDSAPIAGFPPGRYDTLGQEVVLEESGKLWNPVGNHLVGSSACLLDCMNHLAAITNLGEEELWKIGFTNPLALLGAAERPEWQRRVRFSKRSFRLV